MILTKRFIPSLLFVIAILLPSVAMADGGAPYLVNPIKYENFLDLVIGIVRFFLAGVAVISVLMFVYGGFVFLTSAGNAEAVKKGKDILFWATVGIVTIIGSWVALQFIFEGIAGTTK